MLRAYRAATGVTQREVAKQLGYDTTYVSLIENGRRTVSNVEDRRRFADFLGLAPHLLGVADPRDSDFAAMLQFGDSALRLAIVARESGRPVDAINELWPLITRLEARIGEHSADYDVWRLLARARAELGVFLGDVLPEERLATSARWTGRALSVAFKLADPVLLAYTLRVHGNELRKAGNLSGAVSRLKHAASLNIVGEQPAVLIQLARAASEAGDVALHEAAVEQARHFTHHMRGEPLVNPFVVHEVRLRGCIRTGLLAEAARLIENAATPAPATAPQWRIIERVTVGEVLLHLGDHEGAAEIFVDALAGAEAHRLPHQVQRVIRAVGRRLEDVAAEARNRLARLQGTPADGSGGGQNVKRARGLPASALISTVAPAQA